MTSDQKKLIREQLDATLKRFSELKSVNPPNRGWIRAIRDALGISTRQLGDRLGVAKSRITRIEQDEVAGNVTLKTMQRVADTLDCVFVYGFVPRTSLEETVKNQARHVAQRHMARVAHTMAMEDQGLSEEELKSALDRSAEELIKSQPKTIWNKDE